MKNFLKKAGKFAYNVKSAPFRAKAKLVQMGANAVGAKGIADMAGKVAQPLNKGGMPDRNYKRNSYAKGGSVQPSYKHGEMPKCMPK